MIFKFIYNKHANNANKWEMQDMRGGYIQSFPDCSNLHKVAKGLDKTMVNIVSIKAEVIKKKCLPSS